MQAPVFFPPEKSTILIVDDEQSGQNTLEALLLLGNYNLIFAPNGNEALQKAREFIPDVILLDIMMPDMDGFEVCQQIRSDPDLFEIPVIMVTALDDRDSRLRGLEVGANDFVTKPFDRVELRTRIRTIAYLNRQRRLRTMELQIERDYNRAILDALGEALVVTDKDGIIQYVNQMAIDTIEAPGKSLVGKNWLILSDNNPTNSLDLLKEKVVAGETWQEAIVGRRQDGATYDAMLTVAPLPGAYNKEPAGFIIILQDITPLKEAERMKDQFVSNVSHELKTPLSVITLITDNLETLYDRLDDGKRQKMLRDIQKHTQNLNTLIDSIMEVSRLDSKRISLERVETDLGTLTQETVERLLPLAEKKNQQLAAICLEPAPIWGNESQLRQVIRNLISNAIKYTPRQGQITCMCSVKEVSGPVTVKSEPGVTRWAVLAVIDNGPGIQPEALPHIFERFYRAKPRGNVRGAGLGLSIAKELITLHNGYIDIDSTPGEGSVFTVYLPVLQK